jgi:hypothetical protein
MTKRKPAANRKGRWANYNGPGKPITVEQLHQILAERYGIEPTRLPNGEWGYWREQFEAAWSHLDRR